MPVSLALLMAVTAALLAASVCAVLWRKAPRRAPGADPRRPARTADWSTVDLPAAVARLPTIPRYEPPAGTVLAGELEVDQTFHLQTATAKYVLTLRDPIVGLYDAVRIGPKDRPGQGTVHERFQMIFAGTFVPYYALRFGEFVPGGNLSYRKIRDGQTLNVVSTPVVRVLLDISARDERLQQAS